MHQDLSLFATITMAIVVAFAGGYIARRFGLPTLVGYLLAGMVIGPFTPGFVGDVTDAQQLAEMGVIFMLFGVGLHFSLKDLWAVRSISLPGSALQMLISTVLGVALTQLWGWPIAASVVLGLSISIASTVVLLRGLEDNGLLNTSHGKVAIGWLVLEDLATVGILVLLPALVGAGDNMLVTGGVALLKTALFVALILFLGRRVLPWILTNIAHMRSRELFILTVVAVALGTAFGAAELFGVSLALGAFLAGVVIGESRLSHRVGAAVLPFREIFAVLFFVSVGMLVNPAAIVANIGYVLSLTGLVVVGKLLVTLLLGMFLPGSGRTMLIVAVALSQIGEFSFILGQAALRLDVLTEDQYGLILAAALLSIIINPLLYRALPWLEATLQRLPRFWSLLNRGGPTPQPLEHGMSDHVVIVGYGRVGKHIGTVLKRLGLPFLIIEQDAARAVEFQNNGQATLLGDAADSEILTHAGLERARALVVTMENEIAVELVVSAAHDLAPDMPIIARAATTDGVQRLAARGADDIIHPELEGGLEVVRHTLLVLGFAPGHIQRYVDTIRKEGYGATLAAHEEHRILDQLIGKVQGTEIAWYTVSDASPVVGLTLPETKMRSQVGASVIALVRDGAVIPNPDSQIAFKPGDLVGLIGAEHELAGAERLLGPPATALEYV